MPYLSKAVLKGFDNYKYNAVDTSPVSRYVTHPFWNRVVLLCPRWIAPNILTLSGFLFLVLQFCILTYYDNHFYASSDDFPDYPIVPKWVWLMCAICIFMSHTLDGIDGKQARRTGTSGPLGELFDHGLDSWATLFIPIGIYSVFGRADNSINVYRMYYVAVGVMYMFAVSHFEKYCTGVLFLPWGYDLSQIALTALFLFAYIFGYEALKFDLPILNMPCGHFMEVVLHAGTIGMSLPMTIWNVYSSYRHRTGRMLPFGEAVRPLLPSTILFVCMLLWAFYSPYKILDKEPRMFIFASGTVFSNSTNRLIVSGMSHTRCQSYHWLLSPLIAIVLSVIFLGSYLGNLEFYFLYVFAAVAFVTHLHYGYSVVHELANHLNIYAFSVQKPLKSNQ